MKRPVFQSRRALRDLRHLVINYRQLAEIAGNPEDEIVLSAAPPFG
jgi:hypothetical protein